MIAYTCTSTVSLIARLRHVKKRNSKGKAIKICDRFASTGELNFLFCEGSHARLILIKSAAQLSSRKWTFDFAPGFAKCTDSSGSFL